VLGRVSIWLVLLASPLVFAAAAGATPVGDRQDRPLSWSADGGRIVFERSNVKHGGDFVVHLDGSRGLERLPEGDSEHAWSPDSRRLVFARDGEIFVADSAGRYVRQLTWQNDPDHVGDDVIGWSPGGTWIAFQRTRLRQISKIAWLQVVTNVWLIRPDGSGLHRLSQRRGSDWGASWSPDGRQVVFARQSARHRNDLYVADLVTGGERRLTYSEDNDLPAWSPRGDEIVFERAHNLRYDADVELWSIRPDGSGLRDLTPFKGGNTNPVWSPDGRTIAFEVDSRRTRPHDWEWLDEIWLMRPDGTHQRPLFRRFGADSIPEDEAPVWSPDSKRIAFARFDYGQEQTGGVTRMSLHVVGADGRHARRLTY